VANTVNQFLYSLYSALDNTHQSLEAKLIGDQVAINAPQATFPPGPTGGGTNNTLLASIVQQVQTSEGQVSGAFSAASAEFRQATNTASANLSSVWTSFAASLQNSANVTLLTGQIATGKSQIQILQTQAQQLQAAMTNNQVNPGNLPAQLAELQQKISTQTSAVNSLQAQLAALPAPPKV
jgi:chromosome segregation ATPase